MLDDDTTVDCPVWMTVGRYVAVGL